MQYFVMIISLLDNYFNVFLFFLVKLYKIYKDIKKNGMGTETTSATYRRTQIHESQSFSTELLESKGTGNEQLML